MLADRIKKLQTLGFIVGDRDPNLNRAFTGRYMVAEPYEPGTVTDDSRNGPRCIVGDNLVALVQEVIEHWID